MAVVRYIPEVIIKGGCRTCPYYRSSFDGDDCIKKNNWLFLHDDPNIARNQQMDPDCPLPTKEI